MYRQFGDVFRGVAREILAGHFHSIDHATQVLGERLKAMKSAG